MGCQECKKWEEHFYWNHLDSTKVCFFKVLIADFSKILAIPRKFALNFKDLKDLQDGQVKLKGPSSDTWRVKLHTWEGEVFFAEGWTEFAKDYELEEGDFLVFRYAGESCFQVQAFEMTGCEKEHTYLAGENAAAAAARDNGGKREKSGEVHEDGRSSFTASQTKAAAAANDANLVARNGRKAAAASTSQHQNVEFKEDEEEEGKDEASAEPSQTCKDYGPQPRMLPRVTMNNCRKCSSSIITGTAVEKQKALS